MTVQTPEATTAYAGDDTTVDFAFPFYFLENAQLLVLLLDAGGVLIPQVLDSDYTVVGAGVSTGGTVTMTTPPATGEILTLGMATVVDQQAEFVPNDTLSISALQDALDKLTMLAKELHYGQCRESVRSIVSSSGTLAIDLADKIAVYQCEMFENITGMTLDNYPPYGTCATFTLELTQDGTGGRTFADGLSASYPGGAPVITATANHESWIEFTVHANGAIRGIPHLNFIP